MTELTARSQGFECPGACFVKSDKPLSVGQAIHHRQYGTGIITRLIPGNLNIVKAVFDGESNEQIVQVRYLAIAKA